jgi:hypothetical protein
VTDPQYIGDPNYRPQYPPPAAPGSPAPYYQPAPAAGYGIPVMAVAAMPTSGLAVASMVLGIVGVTFGWFLLGIPCLLAVIFGHIGLNQTRNNLKAGRGMAIAGLVLGYIFIIPTLIVDIDVFLIAHAVSNCVNSLTC